MELHEITCVVNPFCSEWAAYLRWRPSKGLSVCLSVTLLFYNGAGISGACALLPPLLILGNQNGAVCLSMEMKEFRVSGIVKDSRFSAGA